MKVKQLIKELQGINPDAEVQLYIPYNIEEDHERDFVSDEFEIIESFLDYDPPFIELFSTKDIQSIWGDTPWENTNERR